MNLMAWRRAKIVLFSDDLYLFFRCSGSRALLTTVLSTGRFCEDKILRRAISIFGGYHGFDSPAAQVLRGNGRIGANIAGCDSTDDFPIGGDQCDQGA